jgi:hypothetical protein
MLAELRAARVARDVAAIVDADPAVALEMLAELRAARVARDVAAIVDADPEVALDAAETSLLADDAYRHSPPSAARRATAEWVAVTRRIRSVRNYSLR